MTYLLKWNWEISRIKEKYFNISSVFLDMKRRNLLHSIGILSTFTISGCVTKSRKSGDEVDDICRGFCSIVSDVEIESRRILTGYTNVKIKFDQEVSFVDVELYLIDNNVTVAKQEERFENTDVAEFNLEPYRTNDLSESTILIDNFDI